MSSEPIDFYGLKSFAQYNRSFIDIFETIEKYIRRFIVFQSDKEPVLITN